MNGHSKQYAYQQAQQAAASAALHVSALVKVISFNPAAMTVNVQPLAPNSTQVLGVPIAGTRGGGFLIRPWYKPGDLGIVVYLDHDIDEALSKGTACAANTERGHSDNDAVFVGGVVAGGWDCPKLPEGVSLSTEDGAISLTVTAAGVVITGDVTVTGDVIADGISLKKHLHSGVTSGGAKTAAPEAGG